MVTHFDQNNKNGIDNSLKLSKEAICIHIKNVINEEINEDCSHFGSVLGCDDCFTGLKCICHVNRKPKAFDKCYIPLNDNIDSKTCG